MMKWRIYRKKRTRSQTVTMISPQKLIQTKNLDLHQPMKTLMRTNLAERKRRRIRKRRVKSGRKIVSRGSNVKLIVRCGWQRGSLPKEVPREGLRSTKLTCGSMRSTTGTATRAAGGRGSRGRGRRQD